MEPESSEGALRRDHRQPDLRGRDVGYSVAIPPCQTPVCVPVVACASFEREGVAICSSSGSFDIPLLLAVASGEWRATRDTSGEQQEEGSEVHREWE